MSKLQVRNESIINAPVSVVWGIITDISLHPKIQVGVISAYGQMDRLGEIRVSEMDINGRTGTVTEEMVDFIPEKRTVWAVESETMGMSKMIKEGGYAYYLEKLDDNRTKVTLDSYYQPANFLISVMNEIYMKRMLRKVHEQMLENIRAIAE